MLTVHHHHGLRIERHHACQFFLLQHGLIYNTDGSIRRPLFVSRLISSYYILHQTCTELHFIYF
ncbi:unnamed protein product [Plutella xylostella]|uniref:(diamondback moth) hypothetical protein n=1 Tax=Plutella xylostella TaxID=51655 RepID=A0A8S4GAX8_PLUXY|nr:unnamed protein product [Plutella xylostella]